MALKLSENSIKVLKRRYLKKNENGKVIETPDEMFRRVARAMASAEKEYGGSKKEIADLEESFYRIMVSLEFMPNSPTLITTVNNRSVISNRFISCPPVVHPVLLKKSVGSDQA